MNTDYKHIDNILNKYFEGLTNLQEEAELHRYFRSGQVAAAHQPYQPLFQYINQAQQVSNPKPIQMPQAEPNRRFYYAASVALLIGLGLVWLLQNNHKTVINLHGAEAHIHISNQNPQKQKDAEKELKKFTRNVSQGLDKTGALSIFGQTTKKVFNLKTKEK